MSQVSIVRVPAVWSCKLHSNQWLNLAHIRHMEVFPQSWIPYVTVTWDNGNRQIFEGEDANILIDAWEQAHKMQRDTNEGDRGSE
ncbi:MAG: hypothetical protein F6J93_19855 [Oscillatoria sp. SIO1A7]|nr:hypothetical protein [Oscillatoria sp. SIO1A7]